MVDRKRWAHDCLYAGASPGDVRDVGETGTDPGFNSSRKVVILARTWKTFGYSEAAVGELAFPLFPTDNPSLGVYAKPDGIQLQLKVTAEKESEARQMLEEGEKKIRQIFDSTIWGTDNETLETVVGHLLVERKLSLAIMEDYTGGQLTTGLAAVPDSQAFFNGGFLAQANKAKISLGVNAKTISAYGASSREVAAEMAEVARQRLGADIGIGITGTGLTGQPVVYVAILNGKHIQKIRASTRKRKGSNRDPL